MSTTSIASSPDFAGRFRPTPPPPDDDRGPSFTDEILILIAVVGAAVLYMLS